MQNVSQLYKQIISEQNHEFEVSLVIDETGSLIDENEFVLMFGDTSILVATDSADAGYREDMLYSIETSHAMFSDNEPEIGAVISGEIDVSLAKPISEVQRKATLRLYVRATDGTNYSEWIPQGVYFCDTREITANVDGIEILTIHGYDAIIKTETTYPSDDSHDYPLLDVSMVQFIADSIGVEVDERTWIIMTDGYMLPLPAGYSCREVLKMIASAYAGSFVMTEEGKLRLIQINEMPPDTKLLIDHAGYRIVFGSPETEEVRILV